MLKIVRVACLALLCAAPALADASNPVADLKGTRDNPLVKRYEGAFIVDATVKAFEEFALPLSVLEETGRTDAMNNSVFLPKKSKALEGRLTRLVYVVPAGRSTLEVLRNYEDEVAAKGGQVLYQCKGEDCGGASTRGADAGGNSSGLINILYPREQITAAAFSNGSCAINNSHSGQRFLAAQIPAGGDVAHLAVMTYQIKDDLYCKALNDRTVAIVTIVEPKAREKKMVTVSAAEMGKSIAASGRVALYGILFDTAKADVKPESDAALAEIAALLKVDPALKLYVVGHTDSVGGFGSNMDLSGRRASAVVEALAAKFGVAKARLQPAGVGPVSPVASNEDEAGRAKNRRVELVKQ